MNINLLAGILLYSGTVLAQEPCGFDKFQTDLHNEFHELKNIQEYPETLVPKSAAASPILKTKLSAKYNGEIYEIPIVVHVIQSNSASNTALTLTDTQIQTWVESTNKIYATTYGNGFFPEGNGSLDGTVLPFKFVFAKRDPSCNATTGIVRYDGSTLPGYDSYGVQFNTTNGVSTSQIKTLAPHWPEHSYFNIYIVIGFDGDTSDMGVNGWAGTPTNPDAYYEAFMKVAVVTKLHSITLAHEFGHALGLLHPFDGGNTVNCPTNVDCTTDNDKVCDTEAIKNMLPVYPSPGNSTINPCSSQNYQGGQYNIMNYVYEPRKFTNGQRDRAIAMFVQYRGNLIQSLATKEVGTWNSITTLNSVCTPSGITHPGDYGIGPTRVTLGNIDMASSHYNTYSPNYYTDYSTYTCLNKKTYTDLTTNSTQTLQVSIGGANSQYIKAWIDYNNNGIFESSELIANSNSAFPPTSSPFSATFTPPLSATLNTYLRMRVRSDLIPTEACDNPSYGQVEDYPVRLTADNTSIHTLNEQNIPVYFDIQTHKLILSEDTGNGFGSYTITDATGKTLLRGTTTSPEISLKTSLGNGFFLLHYHLETTSKMLKFIK